MLNAIINMSGRTKPQFFGISPTAHINDCLEQTSIWAVSGSHRSTAQPLILMVPLFHSLWKHVVWHLKDFDVNSLTCQFMSWRHFGEIYRKSATTSVKIPTFGSIQFFYKNQNNKCVYKCNLCVNMISLGIVGNNLLNQKILS